MNRRIDTQRNRDQAGKNQRRTSQEKGLWQPAHKGIKNIQTALPGGAHVAGDNSADIPEIAGQKGIVQAHGFPERLLLLNRCVLRQDLLHGITSGQIHGPEDQQGGH